jgi:hypothetical protein
MELILKSDRRGLLRHTPEQKRARVEACEASGLSFPRIAALHEGNYQTLVSWFKKSRHGDPRMESSTFSDKSHGALFLISWFRLIMAINSIEIIKTFRCFEH